MMKRFYVRFVRLRGTPHQISLGLSLGILVGMTPFLGAHTVIAVFLASLFKWSKITATIGVMITNPFTAPLIYPITYKLGNKVTGLSDPSQWARIFEPGGVIALMKSSPLIIVDLNVGGMIVGIPLAVITYYFALNAVSRARKRIEMRRAKRAAARRAKKTKLPAQSQPSTVQFRADLNRNGREQRSEGDSQSPHEEDEYPHDGFMHLECGRGDEPNVHGKEASGNSCQQS